MSVEQVSGSAWAECPNGVESASTLHRWDKEWRERVVALLHQALQRLEEPMAEVGIVCER